METTPDEAAVIVHEHQDAVACLAMVLASEFGLQSEVLKAAEVDQTSLARCRAAIVVVEMEPECHDENVELVARLKGDPATRNTPVLGYGVGWAAAQLALGAGCDGYARVDDLDGLVTTVARHLQRGRTDRGRTAGERATAQGKLRPTASLATPERADAGQPA